MYVYLQEDKNGIVEAFCRRLHFLKENNGKQLINSFLPFLHIFLQSFLVCTVKKEKGILEEIKCKVTIRVTLFLTLDESFPKICFFFDPLEFSWNLKEISQIFFGVLEE
jgi:hypothetical protein